jgi:hypothetical protein
LEAKKRHELLCLLESNARFSAPQLAVMLDESPEAVAAAIAEMEAARCYHISPPSRHVFSIARRPGTPDPIAD